MKQIEKITPQKENFARWYTDVVQNGDLMAYGSTKGSIIFKPLSYGIWQNIQQNLDKEFKKLNVKNVYLPLLIPENLLNKEKDHLKGFNPELATITEVGGKKLSEKYFIRPTSETLFCDFFANEVESYNDLPLILNQWVNVLRWEKTTNPFLRTREFLWQEGHTIHATKKEAMDLTKKMINVYHKFLKDYLALPTIIGRKTEHEKFAGAEVTLTVEAMMKDGKALQSGTSHYIGQNFSKPFKIAFKNINNEEEYAYETSWGVSTRLLGALIMAHGDDRGIIIPPKIAPIQIDIVTLFANKNEGVLEAAKNIKKSLSKFRVELDSSDKMPGFKAANSEIHGTPIRIEVGPRDLETNEVIIVRRDTLEKIKCLIENIKEKVTKLLDEIQTNLYEKALERLNANFVVCENWEEFEKAISEQKFAVTLFEGNGEDEVKIKELTGASTRCILPKNSFNFKKSKCFYTNKKSNRIVIFAKAY
ncbi:prolyl-tRNA synthetase [Metamycoplasma subdolum]|uniref:Proline--tRNA ligase n=1 Tax=Metamycoplasma subdolum TaxID=92407 RepID=A0A3M0A216_9BACT|nr:proline--tRNA ligase [Metamycoplasma subdolum]RMA79023.1 prolyl-tRNA synthetase [Metamycoplasma subdolum]WPB50546.1 proline--tRNA ligase [Metamycoplasma subdolum]